MSLCEEKRSIGMQMVSSSLILMVSQASLGDKGNDNVKSGSCCIPSTVAQ